MSEEIVITKQLKRKDHSGFKEALSYLKTSVDEDRLRRAMEEQGLLEEEDDADDECI